MNCPMAEKCRRFHYTRAILEGVYTGGTPPTLMELVEAGIIEFDQIGYKVLADGQKRYTSAFCKVMPRPEDPGTFCPDVQGKDYTFCREYVESERKKAARSLGRKPDIRPRRPYISEQTKINVWRRCGYRCWYCKLSHNYLKQVAAERGIKAYMALDHVIPYSAGGGENEENLVLCCWVCNSQKGNRAIWKEGQNVGRTV